MNFPTSYYDGQELFIFKRQDLVWIPIQVSKEKIFLLYFIYAMLKENRALLLPANKPKVKVQRKK